MMAVAYDELGARVRTYTPEQCIDGWLVIAAAWEGYKPGDLARPSGGGTSRPVVPGDMTSPMIEYDTLNTNLPRYDHVELFFRECWEWHMARVAWLMGIISPELPESQLGIEARAVFGEWYNRNPLAVLPARVLSAERREYDELKYRPLAELAAEIGTTRQNLFKAAAAGEIAVIRPLGSVQMSTLAEVKKWRGDGRKRKNV